MNKKYLIGILAIALIAITASSTFAAITWYDATTINLVANTTTSSGPSLKLSYDCAGSSVVPSTGTAYSFGSIMVNVPYEWDFYVTNNGQTLMNLSYLPTTITQNGGQTVLTVTVSVIAYGPPCETSGTTYALSTAVPLPEKPNTTGFTLMPGKEVKLSVIVTATSLDSGLASISIPLVISGSTVS